MPIESKDIMFPMHEGESGPHLGFTGRESTDEYVIPIDIKGIRTEIWISTEALHRCFKLRRDMSAIEIIKSHSGPLSNAIERIVLAQQIQPGTEFHVSDEILERALHDDKE